jgi:hypothetical protein
MKMIQTYQGYFVEDGRFVPDGLPAKIPTKRRAIVNILDDEVSDANDMDVTQNRADVRQKAAKIKKILMDALASEDNGLTDAEWDETSNLRERTNVGLSRAVEI